MTPVWDYGDEGRAFPVKVNEVWAVGKHLFSCTDLMASRGFDEVLSGHLPHPTLLYCDPPWGQSLVNSFRTKAGLGRATYRWEELYARIAQLGHDRGLPVWVEGSKIGSRDGAKIPGVLAKNLGGQGFAGYAEVTYYRKNVSGLYYSGTSAPSPRLFSRLTGMDDDDTPGTVMEAYGQSGVVMDPCAGRGVTSREAERVGWASVNNELNPLRVSAALVRMAKLISKQPMRVAIL